MSTLAEASRKAEEYATTRHAQGAKQKCPLKQTGIIVMVMRRDTEEMIKSVSIALTGPTPGNNSTDSDGMAKFDERDAGVYTINSTLPASLTKDFAAPEMLRANLSWEMYYIAYVLVEPLPRPKIKLLREDDDKAVSEVGVTLSRDAQKYDLGNTNSSGLAEWDKSKAGLKEGPYDVSFKFKPDDVDKVEVVDLRSIQLKAGEENAFTFHVRYCWVEFVVKDQFGEAVSGLDYVLTFPDGKKTKQAKLAEGKVRENGPPGSYKFALKMLVDAAWKDTPLEVDKKTTLRIWASGYDAGTDITIEIFDACGLSRAPLETLQKKLAADYPLEVEWTPTAAKLEKLASNSLIFTAKVGTSAATSGPALVNRREVFEVKDEGGQPVNANLSLWFIDGPALATEFKENKYEALVPWSWRLLAIDVSAQKGRRAGFTDAAGEREVLLSG